MMCFNCATNNAILGFQDKIPPTKSPRQNPPDQNPPEKNKNNNFF